MDTQRLRAGAGRALVATGATVALISFGLSGPAQAGVTGEVAAYEESSLQVSVLVGDSASGYVLACNTADTCDTDEVTYAVTTGALAPGVSLGATGAITGTYTQAGTYSATITAVVALGEGAIVVGDVDEGEGGYASQGDAATATFEWTVVVSEAPAELGSVRLDLDLPSSWTVESPGLSGDVTLIGLYTDASEAPMAGAAYAVTGGTLPPGLALDAATGAVTGTPTMAGDYAVQFEGSVDVGSGGAAAYGTWEVEILPAFIGELTVTVPRGVVGAPFAGTAEAICGVLQSVALSGPVAAVPAPRYEQTGLPDGLELDAVTGEITGTPTAAGTFPFTVTYPCPDGEIQGPAELLVTQPAIAPSPTTVAQGGTVALTGTGFVGVDDLELILNSDPIPLGEVTTDATGAFLAQLVLPATAPVGAHRLEAVSAITGSVFADLTIVVADSGGGAASATPAATTATAAPTDLATTGAETWLAGLALGLVLMGAGLVLEGRRLRPGRIAA